eukprot:gb/GECH01012017.1/.p1 GENE.gb/GECH01012017.1/~~gb/GECH01012017.1/.p1  ORF type:complete len:129 (+),score=18.74 gb/GECH01012017.1/:1-387(+)
MPSHHPIQTDAAPAAIGPYSQAVTTSTGDVYVSGCIGLAPDTMTLATPGVAAEAEQTLRNLEQVLKAAGSGLERVVKVTVLLVDMDDFSRVNEVYAKFFHRNQPARACFAVKALPKGARIEMDAIAYQ